MTKKVKVMVSILLAVVLMVGGTVAVLAQEDETEANTEDLVVTANATGLLPRVAEILGITEEELISAFKQARQEIREGALIRRLDKAVEKGIITQGEADEIKGWWSERPEVLKSGLIHRALGRLNGKHLWGGPRGLGLGRLGPPISSD